MQELGKKPKEINGDPGHVTAEDQSEGLNLSRIFHFSDGRWSSCVAIARKENKFGGLNREISWLSLPIRNVFPLKIHIPSLN